MPNPAQWMARHVLRDSGMSLPWVEERRRIEEALAIATKRLERAWSVYAGNRGGEPPSLAAESRWQEALTAFREQISALNRRIRTCNLSVPHVRFQRCLIEVRREVARLRR